MHNNSGAVVEVRKVMKVSPSTQPIQAHALTLLEPRTPRRRARRPAIGLPRVPNPVHAPPWSSQKDSLSSLLSPWKNEQRRGTRGETVAVVAEMVTLTPNPVTCTSLWRHRRRGRRGVSHTGTYPVEAVHGGVLPSEKHSLFSLSSPPHPLTPLPEKAVVCVGFNQRIIHATPSQRCWQNPSPRKTHEKVRQRTFHFFSSHDPTEAHEGALPAEATPTARLHRNVPSHPPRCRLQPPRPRHHGGCATPLPGLPTRESPQCHRWCPRPRHGVGCCISNTSFNRTWTI